MNQHRKILLDTDIGTNIDDALCLAWLIANPECHLIGITTVTGEAVKRAEIADAICRAAGRDIPVFPGAEQPLVVAQRQTFCEQYRTIADSAKRSYVPDGGAVAFLRRTIRANPGEITLITIGPLTNIALLFDSDPELPGLLGGLVSMCGYYGAGPEKAEGPETNIRLDPHAAAAVFRHSPDSHRCAGLDVTRCLTIDRMTFMQEFDPRLPRLVSRMSRAWFAGRDTVTFHDPLAAMIAMNPDVCKYERGTVSVNLEDGVNQGRTEWRPDSGGTVEIANHVDREGFFSLYSSAFA